MLETSTMKREKKKLGENVAEEAAGEDVVKEHLLRVVSRLGGRAKIEVPMYEGNLDAEELLDWIRSMDKHFDYEEVDEEKRMNMLSPG
jgi:Icc-related predicted phosphoesterase